MVKQITIGLIAFLIIVTGSLLYFYKFSPRYTTISEADISALKSMPLPSRLIFDEDTLFIPRSLGAQFDGFINSDMENAVHRFFKHISDEYTDKLSKEGNTNPFLIIQCETNANDEDTLTDLVSYTLQVDDENIILIAPYPNGILYGLETISQLIESNKDKIWIRSVRLKYNNPKNH